MVRETRHLWVGNLPENIREDRIRDHFKRYGRVQSVKLLGGRGDKDEVCATVSFMDIKSAAKAHHSEQKLDDRVLTTEYHEPAAIPASYSRFHLGSEELSSSFDRSSHFYERGERGEGAGGYIRRSGYHSSGGESLSRTRPRDRASYRNGPYTPIIESVVSRSGSSTGHHGSSGRSGGGGSWSYESPSPRYPPSTPDISYQEPPSNILVHKKHSKSRSGSDSGSNSSRSRSSSASSQSGSSTCSTASSSPASEKSCSTHSQQSTLRSSGAPSGSANHTSNSSPAVHSEDRRPLAICVRNLPARSSDTSLKDGLYHEYKKHGKVTWVKVVGQGVDRYALVSFKKPDDVDKALQVSHDKLFFGCKIDVAPYQGYDVEDNEFRPFEAEQDEFHPKATRTLFIGNLDKDITTQEIRKHFDQFGEIIDIDIKKQGSSSSYAFCQFSDIASVVRAMRSLDGEHVGGNRVKLGFGKSMHTNVVWADGVAESVSEKYLSQQFGQFGPVSHVVIDRARGQALITFEQIQYAQLAVKEMRGVVVRGRKLQVDYASRECQESFYDHMEKQSNTSTHPSFDNSSVASSPGPLRVFESPSSSTPAPCPGPVAAVSSRYNSCSRYSSTRGTGSTSTFPRSASPSSRSSRHSTSRFTEYQSSTTSGTEYERRSSYRSYEDVSQAEESSTPTTTGVGDIRHLQKERVSLLEQLEDCTSSGEEGTNRRRCNKHRRSQSGEGSRPGTPLCDERPENLGPVEPRRPRDSRPPDPLSLPLPRFASQVLSPRPGPPSPPASPLTHSSSSDSEPSPEWEERLRSLDEKYEKWSGSRAGLTKVDPSTLKVRHKLLDLDLHELQPSDIVKSVLAKRSVFDEDSKRLENFGEKYEPREFIPARSSLLRGRLDLSPMSSPVVKSPSSPAAKGLQYPFPSHPPVQPTTSVATATAPSSLAVSVTAAEIKPSAMTFLTNCSRQFPLPKISSPQSEKCDASPRLANTKILPTTPTTMAKPIMSCKPVPDSVQKKDSNPMPTTKVKSSTPLRRESSDDKKEEVRRKSREESVETVECIKRDDLSECDRVKDSQVTERRKSLSEKRRTSSDVRDLCERTKESDRRRGSSEVESESSKKSENKKLQDENHVDISKPEQEVEKCKRLPNDSSEKKKESETNIRHSIDIDKKKDILGVISEKERRKNRESSDSSDNPKHKKVPDNKKDISSEKKDKDDDVNSRSSENERKKDPSDSSSSQHLNRHKEKKDHQDRRRDSSEHLEKKVERISPENTDVQRIKEKKSHDITELRNSKKHHDESDTGKHKESERRKSSENEISKEHSLFKKVFGFAERTYGHHKDRRDSDSTAVKTDETIKTHKRDHSEKERKRDKDSEHAESSSSSSKHKSRKSPDHPENNRHKERKHSESSEKRSRKEYDLADDHKHKDDHSDTFHSKSRDKKEERSKENSKNSYLVESDFLLSLGKQRDCDRRKETLIDESRTSETDSNDLKFKDGDVKKDNEVFFERQKEDHSENRNKDERRKDSEKYFDCEKYNNDRLKKDDSETFKDLDKKVDFSSDFIKFKHDRHRDSERKKESLENCRIKDDRPDLSKHKDDRKSTDDIFDSLKSKDDSFRYRDYSRKKDSETQDPIRIKDIIESKKKDEREKKKERESHELTFKKIRDEEKNREEKSKRKKEYEIPETKMNGDHDDYALDNLDCRKPNYEDDIRIDPIRKEKRKDRNNTWPATIGCKRRLSSQDCLDIVDDAKRSKPERRDSKDSGRSSGSSRKGSSEKHKGYTKLLEEKIKEDKENEQRKKEDILLELSDRNDDKSLKPAIRKEKRNSGEKRKEERKIKNRPRENGTASESDMGSCDEETKASKRQQHSIFDIVDDEPAYISMYDKVKARSTKNMQKQEEEKRQEKLKEKFHQLKASRAKREEKKRSTSYDEDSDSEKGSSRRSNKLLITSSDDDACSESDLRIRSRKVLCDTSEDDSISISRSQITKYSEYDSKSSRKIISDISEDDSVIKHSTPKLKSRTITFEADQKPKKLLSDTSEDDTTRLNIPRQKPSRIQSDDSEDVSFVPRSILPPPFHEPPSSPESIRRISLDSMSSEQPRKKSHKKKQKKKNYEVAEDGTIIIRSKHSSKKEKKKSHRDNDDEDKKSRKRKEKESFSSKREDKFEDIFGPLSDDSEKTTLNKWQVSQVYGSDSESERENIRKKEKKRREKKLRELDEAGRALEAKLLDTSEDVIEEPIKTKKKKRKKSRDEKIKHHRILGDDATPLLSKDVGSVSETKRTESEEPKDSEPEIKIETDNDNEREEDDDDCKGQLEFEKHKDETTPQVNRQHSSTLSSLLDSPPAQPLQHKKPDIPGFGTEVDENIHETAVKSISETTLEEQINIPKEKYEDKPKAEEQTSPEEKPTPVISQEETEDAVAALLMEDTFGSGFERYSGETPKPDTPVSEPDLQIDTDTEDAFDTSEFAKTSREPESESTTTFYPPEGAREGLEERIMPLACSAEVSLKESEKQTSPEPLSEESKVGPDESSLPKPEIMDTSEEPEIVSATDKSQAEKISPKDTSIVKNEIETVIIKEDSSSEEKTDDAPILIKDDDEKSISIVDITDLTTDEDTNSQLSPKMNTETNLGSKEDLMEVVINVEEKEEKKDEHSQKEIVTLDIPLPPDAPESQESKDTSIIKPLHKEKSPLPPEPTRNASASSAQNLTKPEKIIHHQTIPVSHSTVLVHQAIQQPQSAQLVKPLTIQVINPPALKPLEQTNVLKLNPSSPSNIKLGSPPIGHLTTTQAPSFRPKVAPSNQPPMPKPIQIQSFQNLKLPSTMPHLVPPHIPVKPANQISLQTPQLTPISKGNMGASPRPLIVHTIQNTSSQKQLHIVTTNPQLSPQPPLSPQNLKVIRPLSSPGMTLRPMSIQSLSNRSHNIIQSPISNSNIPLLQTVSEAPSNKQFPIQTLSQTPLNANQSTIPEKVVNLTSSPPVLNMPPTPKSPVVTASSTSEVSKTVIVPEKVHETQTSSFNFDSKLIFSSCSLEKPSGIPHTVASPMTSVASHVSSITSHVSSVASHVSSIASTMPSVLVNSKDNASDSSTLTIKKVSDEVHQPVIETKLVKPNVEEPKPLNAVIQDLTIRAANKALGKSAGVSDIKLENSKPIEQVVREIQQRKKAAAIPSEPEKPVSPAFENKVDETPIKLEQLHIKLEQPHIKSEQPHIKLEQPHVKLEQQIKDESSESETKVELPGKELKENISELSNEKSLHPASEEKASKEETKVKVEDVVEEESCTKTSEIKVDLTKDEEEANPIHDENTPPPSINKQDPEHLPEIPETQTPKSIISDQECPPSEEKATPEKSTPVVSSGRGRGGRGGGRGKRGRGAGVWRGRGRGHAITSVRDSTPARPQAPADIYEFRDDSEEERPRLILTIKPDPPPLPSPTTVTTSATTTTSATPTSQSNNQGPSTRKSRRLQEKDGSRTAIEDTIEDVIRCTGRPGRRATRSTAPLLNMPSVETTRKSPRRKQAQSQSSHSSVTHERSPTPQPSSPPQPPSVPLQPAASPQPASSPPTPNSVVPSPKVATPQPSTPQQSAAQTASPLQPQLPPKSPSEPEQPPQKTKEQSPVPAQDLPSPVRESIPQQDQALKLQKEEIKPPPPQKEALALQTNHREQIHPIPLTPPVQSLPPKALPVSKLQSTGMQQQPQQLTVKLPTKLQTTIFNKADLKTLIPQRPVNPNEATTLIDPVTGLLTPMREGEEGQYVPVVGDGGEPPPEKRPRLDEGLVKAPVATVRPSVVRPPQQPPLSIQKPSSPHLPPQKPIVNCSVPRPPKAHLLQAVNAVERTKIMPPTRPKLIPPQTQPIQAPKPPTPLTPKAHILQAIGNAQAREGIIGSPAPLQASILTGSVASPPLRAHPQPIVTGASSARYIIKNHTEPSGRVGPDGGCIVVPTPSSQQPPRGQVLQAGLPVPAYEASLGDVVQHVNYPAHHIQPAHYVHQQLVYQQYLREAALGPPAYHRGAGGGKEVDDPVIRSSPPLELRKRSSPHDRTTDSPQVATLYGRPHLFPPPAHRPAPSTRHQVATPPHASQVPPQADSLLVLLQRYPVMWQGLLALKNDQAAVQMHFVFGNHHVARDSLPCNSDGSTPPLRISQRMRLEQTQLDGVSRKMQTEKEHCMLLALPCGRDHMDVLQQSNNLQSGFITYLQQKQAAGIVNIAAPGSQQAAYVVHIFPACEFANDSLARIAPDLLHRVTDIAHLLIVIATV